MTESARIRFDNLLIEAKYAFHAGDKEKANRLLLEALTLNENTPARTGA
jgi:hypothetical protein